MKYINKFPNHLLYESYLTSSKYHNTINKRIVSFCKQQNELHYDKYLGYDSEIEYLQSTGTQYIDLLFKPSNNKVTVKANLCVTESQDSTILGAVDEDSNLFRFYLIGFLSGKFYACNFSGKWNGAYSINSNNITYNTYYDIESTIDDYVALIVNQNTFTQSRYERFNGSKSLFLFARNESTIGHFSKCKLKYMKIYESDVLIMDLIPVRVGQIGYMYDKVSKQLFGNSGTGDFTLGPDK